METTSISHLCIRYERIIIFCSIFTVVVVHRCCSSLNCPLFSVVGCFVCCILLSFKILIEFLLFLFNMTLRFFFSHFSTILESSNRSYYVMQVNSNIELMSCWKIVLFRTLVFAIYDSFTIVVRTLFLRNNE